jgi:hypothetical protein
VSNYFKILLREMSDPICPYNLYDRFLQLTSVPRENRVTPLKQLVRLMPKINFNTLKYIIAFCITVVEQTEHNCMNSYNIAVTVGPNIFRPKELSPADFVNAGTFYDIMIRFMENFEEIFGSYNYCDEKTAQAKGAGDMDMMA